jgi:hypothetical protein
LGNFMTLEAFWNELTWVWGVPLGEIPTKALAGVLIGRKGTASSAEGLVRNARATVWDWAERLADPDPEFCAKLADALGMIEDCYRTSPEQLDHWCEP